MSETASPKPLHFHAATPASGYPADTSRNSHTSWIQDWRTQWAARGPEDRRLGIARAMGVLILLAIPVGLLRNPRTGLEVVWPGGRYVWTLIIALLPLFIVAVGFSTWRQICPLAFFGRLSEWIGWPDRATARDSERRRTRVPKWLARNYPYVTWGFLAAILTLRLLLINSDAIALALTFIGLILLASLTSVRYTGKSWCNFFCPVSTIELIYTEGDRPQQRKHSRCTRCTGCKTLITGGLCPDINPEKNYRQEIRNPARAFAYYALPGLILGFYVWYFLHQPYYWHQRQGQIIAGERVPLQRPGTIYDWGYYLSGDWTRDPRPWAHWQEPGFGFHGAPYLPTLLAAPLTLALFALISYALFRGIEAICYRVRVRRGMAPEEALGAVRHPLFAGAGFVAFCIFYLFAGAPTLRHLPCGLYHPFQLGAMLLAARVLHTRLSGSRRRLLPSPSRHCDTRRERANVASGPTGFILIELEAACARPRTATE